MTAVRRTWPVFLLLGLLLTTGLSLTVGAAELIYTVKRGDTLSGVAKKHGVSLSALASRNGLKPTAMLITGQRLRIPVARSEVSRGGPQLTENIRLAIAEAPVKGGRWQRIVIHHSGTSQATIKGMIDHHSRVRHMENGLAYHFVIGNGKGMPDGSIYVGNRWTRQLDGGHLRSEAQNRTSLGICLVGNFDQERPTPKQLESLTALLRALQARCRLGTSAIVTHQQVNVMPTRCPGRNFPMKTVLKELGAVQK